MQFVKRYCSMVLPQSNFKCGDPFDPDRICIMFMPWKRPWEQPSIGEIRAWAIGGSSLHLLGTTSEAGAHCGSSVFGAIAEWIVCYWTIRGIIPFGSRLMTGMDTSDSLSSIECMYMPGINSLNSGVSSLLRVKHGKTHANRSLSHKELDIIITGCFTAQQDCYFDSKVWALPTIWCSMIRRICSGLKMFEEQVFFLIVEYFVYSCHSGDCTLHIPQFWLGTLYSAGGGWNRLSIK